jgi:probable F420-dependent oxidoreductase
VLLFGLDIPAKVGRFNPATAAREAERLGFDFVSTNDHLLGHERRSEAWTQLTWLAAATSRVHIASRVLGVPYRSPVLVAKMAETLDRLSGGRLILGLGAGSGEAEYRAMGLPEATVGARVAALDEGIAVIKGLWREPEATFDGQVFTIRAARMQPKPARPIPIWLGTVGPRGLKLLGREADGWIPSPAYAPQAQVPEMLATIRDAAQAARRDPEAIARIYNVRVRISADDPRERVHDADISGTVEQVVDQLVGFIRVGFTGFNFQPVGRDRSAQVERLAAEVMPGVRAAV